MSQPEHMFTFCNTTKNFIQTSSYETNRNTLLSSLRQSSTLGTYSKATIGVSPNTVHGMFLCRGDITPMTCEDFVEDQERVTQPEGSYELKSMVQCSPNLDTLNCTVCLKIAFLRVSTCCGSPNVALIFTPKCLLRYETNVLPSPPLSPSSPPPEYLPPQPSPPQSSPPPSISQTPQSAPPLHPFTQPQNVPTPSGTFSFNVLKRKRNIWENHCYNNNFGVRTGGSVIKFDGICIINI